MINNLDDLRMFAVRHILRQGPADYLLRHSLCKPWVNSQAEDEMAWTDFKTLFFNIPKLNHRLDTWKKPDDTPGHQLNHVDRMQAFLAAACHEILHNLWLHKFRQKDKHIAQWRDACEFAINYDLATIFGKDWITHLGVMYPPEQVLVYLQEHNLPPTTDGFYEALCNMSIHVPLPECKFCERNQLDVPESQEKLVEEMLKVLHQLPSEHAERKDIIRYIDMQPVPEQKLPWEMLLLGGIEDAMRQEQSWSKPSRRHEMLPGWRQEKLLSFLWVLDVSPSIDDEMKQSFMSTLQAGINLYQDSQHRVIFFDQGIVQDIVVSSGTNLSNFQVPSGWGTSLKKVWEILERDLPEYALVLTDLELHAVPKPSYTKIIWGIVNDNRTFDPDYGIKIELH